MTSSKSELALVEAEEMVQFLAFWHFYQEDVASQLLYVVTNSGAVLAFNTKQYTAHLLICSHNLCFPQTYKNIVVHRVFRMVP